MLDYLIQSGYSPVAIIEEASNLAQKGYETLIKDLSSGAHPLPPNLEKIIGTKSVERFTVSNHNNLESENILRTINPDLIVLGDTRIIKPNICNIPPLGIINVHPGYLPEVRGNNPYIWSIIFNLQLGCSVHFIDNDIDTGPLIDKEKIKIDPGDKYSDLLHKINISCAKLMLKAVIEVSDGTVSAEDQPATNNPIFKAAPPETKARAIIKLESGKYREPDQQDR